MKPCKDNVVPKGCITRIHNQRLTAQSEWPFEIWQFGHNSYFYTDVCLLQTDLDWSKMGQYDPIKSTMTHFFKEFQLKVPSSGGFLIIMG